MLEHIGVKNFVPFFSVVLILCLFAFVLPPPVLGSPAHVVTAQEPVTKNGLPFADAELFTDHNVFAAHNNKVAANGAKATILYYGGEVGSFVFNKHNSYIEIEITEHVAVDVVWHCSDEYASCTLKGEGVYRLPQLLQHNGKTESFDTIWIQRVDVHDPTDLPYFIEGSIAAMAVLYPGVTDSQLAQARAQWAEQIILKMERIKETNGAILNPNSTTRTTAYLNTLVRTEDIGGGSTTTPSNALKGPDSKYARFYTPSSGQATTVVATTTTSIRVMSMLQVIEAQLAQGNMRLCGEAPQEVEQALPIGSQSGTLKWHHQAPITMLVMQERFIHIWLWGVTLLWGA